MTHLKVGDKAPDFQFIAEDGLSTSLQSFTGKKLILYFYPKDNTPGCTAEAYGVWGEKRMMGRTYMGIHRITFVIDGEGVIEKIYTKVKTKKHTEQILEDFT